MSLTSYNRRIWIIFIFMLIAFIVFIWRLFDLQIKQYDFYSKKSLEQRNLVIKLNPRRGNIYDNNQEILATSVKTFSIYANPKLVEDVSRLSKNLAVKLNLDQAYLRKKLEYNGTFVWLKRRVNPNTCRNIKYKGVYFLPDNKRVYPGNTIASQLIGFVGTDYEGLSGLEYAYDKRLKGRSGSIVLDRDPGGNNIYKYKRKVSSIYDGKDIMLTIDKNIQFLMENALKQAVNELEATHAVAILMNIKTGEILGMANYPVFNNNKFSDYNNQKIFRNNAVSFIYEPGSVMKIFTIASAIEEGTIRSEDKITSPFSMNIDGTVISEVHKPEEGESLTKNIEDVLVKSLNVGTAKIGLKLGGEKLHKYLSKLGFGRITGLGLSGDSNGILTSYDKWYPVDVSRISFGYGLGVTSMQLLKACTVFGNNGYLINPYIVYDKMQGKRGTRVYSKKTVNIMLNMLQKTVEEGTGVGAQIPFFTLGGKTGTAKIYSDSQKKYLNNRYHTTFLGLFPVSNPKYGMVVMISDARKYKYASLTAVPVFRKIARQVIRYLKLEPDNYYVGNR